MGHPVVLTVLLVWALSTLVRSCPGAADVSWSGRMAPVEGVAGKPMAQEPRIQG
ncbi:hypothetical protein MYSTI_08012 [Myxococcus stipitatus DSM 14675]|uniref:Uncharacterized protein n=1 Tax=Myxococcus stipitatus (strain DSM 14675 / JCM 12634 / Mx s8) TaxID=1278073 RepID=L7UMP5_MYXSD|nr:hypothetical protein MYSTI_08012 [Myxococcus stipitatus DSM 14675]